MNWNELADALKKYGPTAITLGAKIYGNIAEGRGQTEVKAADWAELDRLASQSAEDIYTKEGVTPPVAS